MTRTQLVSQKFITFEVVIKRPTFFRTDTEISYLVTLTHRHRIDAKPIRHRTFALNYWSRRKFIASRINYKLNNDTGFLVHHEDVENYGYTNTI